MVILNSRTHIAQGKLSVKRTSKWLPWALVDVGSVPNPHVLFALATKPIGVTRHEVNRNRPPRSNSQRTKAGNLTSHMMYIFV